VVVLSKTQQDTSSLHRTKIIAQRGNYEDAQLVQHDLGCGDIINASIGDLYNSITVLANDDLEPVMERAESAANTQPERNIE
jgi:hypothetical protein